MGDSFRVANDEACRCGTIRAARTLGEAPTRDGKIVCQDLCVSCDEHDYGAIVYPEAL
jgi:hypothetical protein